MQALSTQKQQSLGVCALLVYVSRQNNTPDQSLGTERQQSNAVMPVRFDKLGHATEKQQIQ